MRVHKYRAWSYEEKCYTYSDDYEESYPYSNLADFFRDADISQLEQYTGLKDKNGKDIYEGDIIKSISIFYGKEKIWTTLVKWDEDIDNDSFGQPLTVGYCIIGGEYEIIGNINETPELLK